ncbi:MAG: acylphosphatase [Phycisphaerales bacterium]|nr:acylphosphatase [Phycisphaerales bacterium]
MSQLSSTTIRRRVLFSGRVQGVGFRYTTYHLAESYQVTGYVKNLQDGRVEAVLEGERAEVEKFFQAIGQEMRSNIDDATHQDSPATGEHDRFEIRYH